MTFAALAEHCTETRYCEAFYDQQGRKLYGVREPKKFASIINRLVSSLVHLKLTDITVVIYNNTDVNALAPNKPRHLHGWKLVAHEKIAQSRRGLSAQKLHKDAHCGF